MTSGFEFQFPWVLLGLAALPLYAYWRGRSGGHAALQFPSAELARAAGGVARHAPGRVIVFIRLGVMALCLVALAGPRMALQNPERRASGVDIMLVLDLSWSMMALDMSPPGQRVSRMDIARAVLVDFVRRRPDDRIGLIVFSAVPYLASPLTLNHDWLVRNLQRLHVGMIRELGTAIGDATAAAAKRLQAVKDSKSRVVILLTDGDNNRGEIEPPVAAQLAAAVGARIHTIGIGLDQPCQLPAFDPQTGRLKTGPNGEIIPTVVLQPANYSVLGKIAALSGGRTYRATNSQELRQIYGEIDRLEKTEVTLTRSVRYTPLYHWPLLLALSLLTVEVILANTRFRRIP